MSAEKFINKGFIPTFSLRFLHPRYWGIWCAVFIMLILAYTPVALRDPLLGKLGRLVGKKAKGARRRARINLTYCFPELSEQQREHQIDQMFTSAPQAMLMVAQLAFRGPRSVAKRVVWHNKEVIEQLRRDNKNIILMVPHGWAIDIPGILLASEGLPVAGMFHNQKNELVDYLWNAARLKCGGRLHARNDGIKPFISSIREGYLGYYLPDEDHGEEQSEFVDFFATYKATLPAIGRLQKLCRADVVPLFPVYNGKTHRLEIIIRPVMSDIVGADNVTIARRMNQEVETLITPHLDQYTWILRLLKTRKNGDIEPYRRQDL